MQWTGLNELREKYLSFFESKGTCVWTASRWCRRTTPACC